MSCYLYENHRGSPTLILLNVLGVLNVLNVFHVLHVLPVLHVLHVLNVLHGRIVGLLGLVCYQSVRIFCFFLWNCTIIGTSRDVPDAPRRTSVVVDLSQFSLASSKVRRGKRWTEKQRTASQTAWRGSLILRYN